ncbi:hypothetical protein MKW98_011303, partial [Papaver atlanticum]
PVDKQFKGMEMSGCLHPYCTDCVAKYIQEKVIEHNMSEIKCANTNCNVMLDASLCQSALPNGVFEKWCRVLCESVVLLDSSKGGVAHGRSYCPYRDCSELILNECVRISASTNSNSTSNKITISNCPNCKKLFCFHCMVPWTENHQCRRHESIIDIETMFCSWRWLRTRDWCNVQIASDMLSERRLMLVSNQILLQLWKDELCMQVQLVRLSASFVYAIINDFDILLQYKKGPFMGNVRETGYI